MKLNTRKILLIISFIILGTICLQTYWNFKNYQSNKLRLKNEVQIAYDKALEIYFNEESKESFLSVFSNDTAVKTDALIKRLELEQKKHKIGIIDNKKWSAKFPKQNSKNKVEFDEIELNDIKSITVLRGKEAFDSIEGIENFPNRITISVIKDSVNYIKLDSVFKIELNRKEISIKYNFVHLKKDSLIHKYGNNSGKMIFQIIPKSKYFNPFETINLKYNYSNLFLIKRMGIELFLSFIFAFSVISCLFFLLYIIKKQKKIDTIKNDFISNITHEFKTPITTIGSALEGMSNFNPTNDIEKNRRYISISKNQLQKLEVMVEKILETATLKTEKLQLKYEQLDLVFLLQNIIEKYKMISTKKIEFCSNFKEKIIQGDLFYLENAFSNLIDNAIKYGGDNIEINLFLENNIINIDVKDDGKGISKAESKIIFEKFYRISRGNIHNIKGYGIGLYYTKTIIEKHYGTLELLKTTETVFRCSLPC